MWPIVTISTCRPLWQEAGARGVGGHATRYPFYADQLTDLVGPDVRTHMH